METINTCNLQQSTCSPLNQIHVVTWMSCKFVMPNWNECSVQPLLDPWALCRCIPVHKNGLSQLPLSCLRALRDLTNPKGGSHKKKKGGPCPYAFRGVCPQCHRPPANRCQHVGSCGWRPTTCHLCTFCAYFSPVEGNWRLVLWKSTRHGEMTVNS